MQKASGAFSLLQLVTDPLHGLNSSSSIIYMYVCVPKVCLFIVFSFILMAVRIAAWPSWQLQLTNGFSRLQDDKSASVHPDALLTLHIGEVHYPTVLHSVRTQERTLENSCV